jgi:hypothetical protein
MDIEISSSSELGKELETTTVFVVWNEVNNKNNPIKLGACNQ